MLCTLKIGKLIKTEQAHGFGVHQYRSTYETRIIQVQVNKLFFYFMRYQFLICLGIAGSITLPYVMADINSGKYKLTDLIIGTPVGLLIFGVVLDVISSWITRIILYKYIPSSAKQERFWKVLEYTTKAVIKFR